MDTCEITAAVTAAANAMAAGLDDERLELAAAVFVQLGETLETIAAGRRLCRRGSE